MLIAVLSLGEGAARPARAEEGRAGRPARVRSEAARAAAAGGVTGLQSDALAVQPFVAGYGTQMDVTLPPERKAPRSLLDVAREQGLRAEGDTDPGDAAGAPERATAAPGAAQLPGFLAQALAPREQPGSPAGASRGFALASAAANEAHTCGLLCGERAAQTTDGCLACHAQSVDERRQVSAIPPSHAGSHPVEVSYAAAAQGRNPTGLRAPESLRREIALDPAGNVTCTTCHDGRSVQKDHLAVANPKLLCLACHDYGTFPSDLATYPLASR